MRVFSFSIQPKDKSAISIVDTIKLLSIKKGIKFSFIVIEALKLYKKEVLDRETTNG